MTRRLGSAFTFSANLTTYFGQINCVSMQLPFQKTAIAKDTSDSELTAHWLVGKRLVVLQLDRPVSKQQLC